MNKKTLSVLLAACMLTGSIGALAGCGESSLVGGGGIKVDKNKTQLYVNNYRGGFGDEWLTKVTQRFEEAYADYVGENGKVGVQIIPNHHKTKGTELLSTIPSSSDEVFFSETMMYTQLVSNGSALDITDIVTETNTDGKTIQSKLYEDNEAYLNMDGRYFALPHYEMYGGISYNINVFEENNLYFAKRGGFIMSDGEERSNGPDGQAGTYDDGLPATYDEFFQLCDYMLERGVTPFTWSGKLIKGYIGYLQTQLYVNYEGYDQIMLNYSLDGTATTLVDSINNDGTVKFKEPTTINGANGYELYGQAGRYYAGTFIQKMLSKADYTTALAKRTSHSHTDAQMEFLLSNYNGGSPIAMFVEGCYWEKEANDIGVYDILEKQYGIEKEDINIGFMPLPHATAEHVGQKPVIADKGYSIAFINAKIDPKKVDLAKDFLKFCYTDESLQEYSASTNTFKGVKYEMVGDNYDKLTNFGKSCYNLLAVSDHIHLCANNPYFRANQSYFDLTMSSETHNSSYEAIMDGVSPLTHFNNVRAAYNKAAWDRTFANVKTSD